MVRNYCLYQGDLVAVSKCDGILTTVRGANNAEEFNLPTSNARQLIIVNT